MYRIILISLLCLLITIPVAAHGEGEAIHSEEDESIAPDFDILFVQVRQLGANLYFHMIVAGEAGATIPQVTGALAGADVLSYVWPTSLDSAVVGFEPEQGILALVVTSHPDFDDTPLWDEDGDSDPTNDGGIWHSHWVVLVADDTCEGGGLKVRDIPEGTSPAVPPTWPQLPILLDSPGYDVELFEQELVVTVPHEALEGAESFQFDGVTAGLRVNANLHDPLLCVTGIDDIASGDLSLPGVAGR